MRLHRVTGVRVRWKADLGLIGYEEAQAICYGLAGFAGTWLGLMIADLLRRIVG